MKHGRLEEADEKNGRVLGRPEPSLFVTGQKPLDRLAITNYTCLRLGGTNNRFKLLIGFDDQTT